MSARDFRSRSLGTADHSAGRIIAICPEDGILGLAIRSQQQPKLRKTIGELHAVEVVTAGADAAKEDRLHRAERVEHGLQFGRVAADFCRQRCTHPVIIRSAAAHVLDPSQDRLLAARHRGLFSESIGDFRNATRKLLLDRLCPGNADPRRDPGSRHRIMQARPASPRPGHRAGKSTRSSWSLEKASAPPALTSNFGRPVSWT